MIIMSEGCPRCGYVTQDRDATECPAGGWHCQGCWVSCKACNPPTKPIHRTIVDFLKRWL